MDKYKNCIVDNNETKKSIYVNAINEYVNLIDNFLPICDKSYGLTSNYRNFIKNNDVTPLAWEFFSPKKIHNNYDDIDIYVVYNNKINKKQIIVARKNKTFSFINNRMGLETLKIVYKMLCHDVHHQKLFIKCKNNLQQYIDKLNVNNNRWNKQDLSTYLQISDIIYDNTNNTITYKTKRLYIEAFAKRIKVVQEPERTIHGYLNCVSFVKNIIKPVCGVNITTEELLETLNNLKEKFKNDIDTSFSNEIGKI